MGLFEHKIRQFPAVIDWARQQDVSALSAYLLKPDSSKLFMGSGGSFSACAFGELLSAECGIMAHAMTPYFYIKSGFERVDADIVLISASGANMDIARAFDTAHGRRHNICAITLQSVGKLQKRFSDNALDSLFCYDMDTGREGFLSTTSVVAFYALLCRAYGYDGLAGLKTVISEAEQTEIANFVEVLKRISLDEMTRHQAYLHKLEGVDSFFILYSPAGYPAALDLESKFSEGAIGNTQLSDYRNFAHGRFNWFTQRPGQTGLICLQTPDDMAMSEEIIGRVPSFVPSLRIRTEHKSPLAAIDLLIKGHYLCSALAERWGLDLSRPSVPDYGRDLYRQ